MVAGRPEKPIDWEEVDKLIMCQCTMKEIAGTFGMHHTNFSKRCIEHFGENFTDYSTAKYAAGRKLLRVKQFAKAIDGNVQLMIKLGEIYLDQKDKQEIDHKISVSITDYANEYKKEENLEMI